MAQQKHQSKYVLVTTEKDGIEVRFTRKQFDVHKNKHVVLQDPSFLPDRIVQALQHPHIIMPDYVDGQAVCYYYEEYAGISPRYTKVVVDIRNVDRSKNKKIYYIKTAFRPDNIKERKYNLKEIYNDGSGIC